LGIAGSTPASATKYKGENMKKLIERIKKFFEKIEENSRIKKYQKINSKLKVKPYFSRLKFLEETAKLDVEGLQEAKANTLMYELNTDRVWFKMLDGVELIQIDKHSFRVKDLDKHWPWSHSDISSLWVEWK
jgi:hypothetical protein